MLNRLVIAVLFTLLPAVAQASDDMRAATEPTAAEEQAREEEWEKCYQEQMEQTGFNACFNACKNETGMDEFNIGAVEVKGRWIECIEKKKCGYYRTLSQYICSGLNAQRAKYLQEWREEINISDAYKNKWVPESIEEK